MNRICLIAFAIFVSFGLLSCSSSKKDEPEEVNHGFVSAIKCHVMIVFINGFALRHPIMK